MAALSPQDIAWASKAMDEGRSLDFVASVLETSITKAQKAIYNHRYGGPTPRERAERYFKSDENNIGFDDEAPERPPVRMGRPPRIDPVDLSALHNNRRGLLRRRFARHWDMIWHLRRCGMCGRTLRAIYGAECLIWSVGGGIDAEI